MKKLMLCLVALAALFATPVLRAQTAAPAATTTAPVPAGHGQGDIAGTWQGTLETDHHLRAVMKISNDNGRLTAVVYSIDQ
jgi:Ni/Co efflux regulator RcnB